MNDIEKVFEDIRNLEPDQLLKRGPNKKVQSFGSEAINVFFFKSGFSGEAKENEASDYHTSYYYVIIENDTNPIPPSLMTPKEIEEKLNLKIDDYY